MNTRIQIPGHETYEKIYESNHTLIFKGRRLKDHCMVVMKVAVEMGEPVSNHRFRKEFELGSRVKSPQVIRYLSMESSAGRLIIVEEDAGGSGLRGQIPEKGFSPDVFLELAIPLVKGLMAIHAANIIHGDLKPGNIVVDLASGQVKIIDFGVSTVWEGEGRQTGKMEGTLAYMSPEQTGRMNRAVDYRTDFYSLGVTFYEMLVGHPPFQARDPLEYVHCHIAREPKEPCLLNPATPPILSQIIMKMMAKNPEERYQSAFGLCGDLEKYKGLEGENHLFELGLMDTHDRFHIPDKVYGRQYEKRLMLDAFERVSGSRPEVLLIMGEAGSGKSALVNELPKMMAPGRGFFICGKFELMTSGAAYSAVTRAFRGLVRQLLGESEDKIEVWRKQLGSALGENARIIAEVIPEINVILGKQKPVDDLPPTETQNRFHTAFQRFVGVFAREEHPLVIFLDDLQWADRASLNLIELLLTHGGLHHLFLVCAFRPNEADTSLKKTLTSWKGQGASFSELVLTPLKNQDVLGLLSEVLHTPKKELRALARLAMQKTEGNPFFIHEWLKTLYQQKAVNFDSERSVWTWSLEKVAEIRARDNVVHLLEKRFLDLPEATRELLSIAACMGISFDCQILARVGEQPLDEILEMLEPALRNGVLISVQSDFSPVMEEVEPPAVPFPRYRFQHDKIHLIAYELNSNEKRPEVHLKLGRALLTRLNTQRDSETLRAIVTHFNKAASLITTKKERRILVRFNLKLGRKCGASADYENGLLYLEKAVELLPQDCWKTLHDLSFLVHVTLSETHYLMGNLDEGESISQKLFSKARTPLEKARIMMMRVNRLATYGKWTELIKMGVEAIALLGIQIPFNPSRFYLWKEELLVKRKLDGLQIKNLATLPQSLKLETRVLMRLLMNITAPSHVLGNRKLYRLLCLSRVKLAISHGVQPESISAFVTYGSLYGIIRDDFAVARTFGDASLSFLDKLNSHELETRIRVLHTLLLKGWLEHWKTLPPVLEKSIETGLNSGDFMFAAYACVYVNHWNPTMDLGTYVKSSEKYLTILQKTRHEGHLLLTQILTQYRRNLMGLTYGKDTLDDDHFNEQLTAGKLAASDAMSGLAVYHLLKLQLHFTYENYKEAERHLKVLERLEVHLDSMLHMVDYRLYGFLTTIMTWPGSRLDRKHKLLRLRKEFRHVCKWAEDNPENFLHLKFIMEAEWARIRGKTQQAGACYEKAMETARSNGYPRYQTLAAELAGRFYQSIGQPRVATLFFRDARDLYKEWGANAKVYHLEDRHIHHLSESLFQNNAVVESSERDSETSKEMSQNSLTDRSSRTDSGHILDMATVTKASQAISSEMDMDRLVVKILTIILENAGAQKGFLIMDEDRRLFVKAAAHMEEEAKAVSSNTALDKCNHLSKTIVRYVFRTGQNLVLNNALEDEMFGKTPYIREKGVKSILCTPIYRQDHVLGVLYLENNLIANAFIKERLKLLQVLLSQAAISLENARLYSSSHALNQALLKEIEERKQAEAKVRSLNEALEERVEERTMQLQAAQRELIEKAHQAGMAEIATSVLHNVGNILNSVITSSQMIQRTVVQSRLKTLGAAGEMLDQNKHRMADFLTEDPKGKGLLEYFRKVGSFHQKEQVIVIENVERLVSKINAIRDVIMYQQSHATMGFQPEKIELPEVVEDCLLILSNSLSRHQVHIEKLFDETPPIFAQKVKLLHIVINIVKNAKEAIDQGAVRDRRVTISIKREADRVALVIQDTGVGIARENLNKIFSHGFTTKPENHGFGLHGCANSLTEMGATISAFSEGLGKGATFVLHFPIASQKEKTKEAATV